MTELSPAMRSLSKDRMALWMAAIVTFSEPLSMRITLGASPSCLRKSRKLAATTFGFLLVLDAFTQSTFLE